MANVTSLPCPCGPPAPHRVKRCWTMTLLPPLTSSGVQTKEDLVATPVRTSCSSWPLCDRGGTLGQLQSERMGQPMVEGKIMHNNIPVPFSRHQIYLVINYSSKRDSPEFVQTRSFHDEPRQTLSKLDVPDAWHPISSRFPQASDKTAPGTAVGGDELGFRWTYATNITIPNLLVLGASVSSQLCHIWDVALASTRRKRSFENSSSMDAGVWCG